MAALLGREQEIEVVRRFLSGAAVDGRALLLTGPAGVGRTALLDAAVAMASAAGAVVARTSGTADGTDRPFAALGRLLAPLSAAVGELDPTHRAVLRRALGREEGPPAAVVAALIAALEAAAGPRPVLVAVDDLPLVDEPSAACLRLLARRVSGRRIGLLATARTDGAGDALPDPLPVHRVGPLDADAAALLATRDPARADRDRVLREAAGTPPGPDRERRAARAAFVDVAIGGHLGTGPPDPDAGGSLWAAATRAHVLLHGDGDLDATPQLLLDALEAVADDPDVEPAALTAALDTLLMICRVADRDVLWSRFHRLAARHAGQADAPAGPLGTVRAGWSLLATDRVEQCGPDLRRLLDDGLRGGAAGAAIGAAVPLALDAFASGRWDDACRIARQGRALAAAHGHETLAVLAEAVPALVAACRGDETGQRDRTGRMLGWAAPRGARLVHDHAVHARVLAALGRGDAESAFHLACAISRPGTVAADGPGRVLVLDLVEAAVRTQGHDAAAAHVHAARKAAVGVSGRSALVAAAAAALTAQGDEARATFEQALAVPGVEAWPFDLARVRLAYGEHLRRSRATLDARLQLTASLATFRGLGADPWTARAESELRAAGHRTPRIRGTAPTVLSHQERTVARLAATGATNRQIGERLGLSPRTVGSHLTRAFQKLGVTSRAALGEALRGAPRTDDRA